MLIATQSQKPVRVCDHCYSKQNAESLKNQIVASTVAGDRTNATMGSPSGNETYTKPEASVSSEKRISSEGEASDGSSKHLDRTGDTSDDSDHEEGDNTEKVIDDIESLCLDDQKVCCIILC